MNSDSDTNKMECENQEEESDNSDYEPLGNLLNNEDDGKKKRKKRGIIYLSKIPKYMNVTLIRETFSKYGEVGRVYLQLAQSPDEEKKLKKKKPSRHFTEGWVEFESKKVAKLVAVTLNNTQISTRKRSKFYDVMWNIKYLPRFKWVHLSERLAYEKAVHKQRLKAEIAQAKREINFYSYNVDRSKKLQKKQKEGQSSTFIMPEVKQRDTDNEIRMKKMKNMGKDDQHKAKDSSDNRKEFLKSLFS